MSKTLSIFAAFMTLSVCIFAQDRGILWQETIGGQGDDEINAMATDAFGNYYITGTIQSENSHHNHDLFVSKVSLDGQITWTRKFSGEKNDRGIDILISGENKIMVLAVSDSKTNEFSGNKGYDDFYVFQLSLHGDLEWSTSYGGEFIDIPTAIIERQNGDFLIYGDSRSLGGDISENYGQFDTWLVDINLQGEIQWQKSFGGQDDDRASKLVELPTEEIVLLGHSTSFDQDIVQNYGDFDVTMIKTNSLGDIIWSKNFGGFDADLSADLLLTDKGNLLVAGNTLSNEIDIVNNAGFSDAWVFEVTTDGELNWSQTIGSSGSDFSGALHKNSLGQVIIAGTTNSLSIGNSISNGNTDIWMASIEEDVISPVTLFGDAGFDAITSVLLTDDNQLVFGGTTNSVSGIVNGLEGRTDGWIAKFSPSYFSEDLKMIQIHPNPSNGIFYLNNLRKEDVLHISDSKGQRILQNASFNGTIHILDLNAFPSGIYYLTIDSYDGSSVHKVIKQ